MHHSVVIIGSGPAGYTAAIYLARGGLTPVLYTGLEVGGQLSTTTTIENYSGFANGIDANQLMNEMQKQAENVGAKIVYDIITKADFSKRPFSLTTDGGQIVTADSIIICSGASAKWLGLENENLYKGGGVSACATCDGALFKNKVVGVVGGGNTAVEEALFLTNHASKVYLIHRRDTFKAEKIMLDKVLNHPKIELITNHYVVDFIGNGKELSGVELQNTLDSSKKTLNLDGLFVAIGHKPNTDFLGNQITLDDQGYIITKTGTTKTNIEGVFAAGDVQDKIYRQAITAAGSGCMAALEVQHYLMSVNK